MAGLRVAVLAMIVVLAAAPARATFSIVAVDRDTGQVGGAGASCVRSTTIYQIYRSSPGHGVVHAQALLSGSDMRLTEAVRLLALDTPPEEILIRLTDPAFDDRFAQRQYGIVDLRGRAAGYTGSSTLDWNGDAQGEVGAFVYSVQGNILTGPEELPAMEAAFADGCDLADRLVRALEAAGRDGLGDRRCVGDGIPADGAFVQVDRSGEPAGSYLRLRVDDVAPEDPLVLLRDAYDAWRAGHPCPAPPLDAGPPDAGSDATVPDASTADAATADAARADAAAGDAGTTTSGGGCGCRTAREAGSGWLLALAVLALFSWGGACRRDRRGRARRSPRRPAGPRSRTDRSAA